MNNYLSLLHASHLVKNIDVAENFYCNILGFTINLSRPSLGYPGLWLDVGDTQQIHLMELEVSYHTDKIPEHGGRDRHVAIQVNSLLVLKHLLIDSGITFTSSLSGRKALFCRDPDGNALEFIEHE